MASTAPTADRAARADRIRALGYDYASQPKDALSACNLCGGTRFTVVAHRDRYGYPAEAHGCDRCGLVFINPVMTVDAYGRFYDGIYRPLVSAYHGRTIDARSIQGEQRTYAAERGDFLAPFCEGRGYQSLLDIGGSTGVVAHALSERFGLRATVLDPAPLEIAEAQALGIETVTGFMESYDPGDRRFDVVTLCQTIDHLRDVAGTLAAVRRVLAPEGLFYVDIVDLRAAYLRNWSVEEAIKIDHPYYFTDETARAALARAGFEILRSDYAADHLHIGYACRAAAPDASALPAAAAVTAHFHEMRYVQNVRRS